MDKLRLITWGYAAALALAGMLNYIPGLTDPQGRAFGIFALDIFDDLLHFASAAWAAVAASRSRSNSIIDGLMGLITGSGYLDLGIVLYGWQDLSIVFKIFANLPHLALGGFAAFSGFVLAKRI
jgi:hypothetical protein